MLGLILFSFVFKQIQVLSGPVYSKVRQPAPTIIANRLSERTRTFMLLGSNEKLHTIASSQIISSCVFPKFVKKQMMCHM